MNSKISRLTNFCHSTCEGCEYCLAGAPGRPPLAHIREYLADRIQVVRKELVHLRHSSGAGAEFLPAIAGLEELLCRVDQATNKVMGEIAAMETVASALDKMCMASTLMGAVARSHARLRVTPAVI